MSNVNLSFLKIPSDDDWLLARNIGRVTQGLPLTDNPPSIPMRRKMIASEHSPDYEVQWVWLWENIPYNIAMHFRTHTIGSYAWSRSSRNDKRKDIDGDNSSRNIPISFIMRANIVSLIGISQSRKCLVAYGQTRKIWEHLTEEIVKVSPELDGFLVKPCIYRNGICPEIHSDCRYNESKKFRKEVEDYRKVFIKLKNGK